nr:YIP1 family protein [uncultured Holophaga sp.]
MTDPQPIPALSPEGAPVPPRGPGLLQQLEGVFTGPVELFRRLHRTPVWLGATILMIMVNLVMVVAWSLKVDVEAMLRPVLEQNPQLSYAQIDQIIGFQSRLLIPMGLVGALVGIPLAFCVAALVRCLVGKGLAEGGRPSYRQAFSSVAVSSLVTLPYSILIFIMCLVRRVGGLRPEMLSPTSLGYYVHAESARLQGFFSQLDVFLIASYVMIYLSCRHTLRLKAGGAWLCVLVSLAFTLVTKVALAK